MMIDYQKKYLFRILEIHVIISIVNGTFKIEREHIMRNKSRDLMLKIWDYAEQFTLDNSRTQSTAEIGEALESI